MTETRRPLPDDLIARAEEVTRIFIEGVDKLSKILERFQESAARAETAADRLEDATSPIPKTGPVPPKL